MPSAVLMFALLAVVVLLPIVPAYLLFRALPSRANAKGLLHGLEVKLGGAFAGYFILVVLILTQLSTLRAAVQDTTHAEGASQVWRVEGQVVDEAGNPIEPLGPNDVQLMPRSLDLQPDGYFTATFVTTRPPAGQGVAFPRLTLSHPGYQTRSISLGPPSNGNSAEQMSRDEALHVINLNPVKLKKLPAYSGTGVPPVPVENPQYPKNTAPGKPREDNQ